MVSHFDTPLNTVRRALTTPHTTDEQALAAAEILAERLERTRRFGGLFEHVSFSPQMESLLGLRQAVESTRCAAAV